MSSTVEFYYSPLSPPSRCAWIVLEQLGIDYKAHVMDMSKGEHKTPEFKKINPRAKVPALKDGDIAFGESRAIAAYLVSEYGSHCSKQHLYPADPKKRALVDQHLYISENVSDDLVSYANYGGVIFGTDGQSKAENIGRVRNALSIVEEALKERQYVTGDSMTIADIFYYVIIGNFAICDFNEFDSYPKIQAWQKKMAAGLNKHKETFEEPLAKFRDLYVGKLKAPAK